MAEINYINGYEIADAKSRGDASEALSKSNSNSESISDLNAEIVLEKSTRQSTDAKLQTQINSLASGSPKDVYATVAALEAANPDTGVYIVSADGHIYSWTKNGTDATDLGVYQATSISDDSITMAMLKDEAKDNMFTGNLAYKDLVPGFVDPWGVLRDQTENMEYTTPLIDLSNDKYIKLNVSFSNPSLSWVAIGFYNEDSEFIGTRNTYAPATNGKNEYINKITNAKYCRLSYRTNTLEYIYFTTDSRSNINTAITNENFDGYTLMYEGKAKLKSKELIEGATYRHRMTYKLPEICNIFLKSKFVANLGNKEFTIAQKTDGSIWDTDQRYYIYYDAANDQIKYRSIRDSSWDGSSTEFKKYILIGFVNNQYGNIELYGQNYDLQFQDKLCGIVNGFDDNKLPSIESNHFKLATDTALIYNNKDYGGNNFILLPNGADVDLTGATTTILKVGYLKDLKKVVYVPYNSFEYYEDGVSYYPGEDNFILIAIIRTRQKLMSINSPYMYDGKLFGLDLKHYACSKLDLVTQKRIGSLYHPEYKFSLIFIITDKLPKGTKFSFKGSNVIYKWSVIEMSSDEIPDTQSSYPTNEYVQTDSDWLNGQNTYTSKYNGYKVVHLAYRDTTKEISTDKVFNEYFNVSLPYNSYEDSVLKEINNLNLDEKLNLNLYPSRIGSKINKWSRTACVLVVDNKLPAGSKIKFKQLEGKDYRWAVVEATETFPNGHTIVDSGWKTTNEGEYETTSEAYIFLTLGDKNNQNLTTSNLPDLYASFEIIPNNQINKLENEIEQIDYENDKLKLIDVNENIKAVNHRGFNTIAPENTLPAYKLSKQKGFFYVETDVSFTSDDVPVCLHDNTINRTARNADGTTISETININDITFADVREYDFGIWKSSAYAGTQIPSLEEFLTLCKNLGLHPYIELKNSATYTEAQIQSLVDMVKRLGMDGKVTWISFSLTYLTYVKNYDNKARLGFLTTPNTAGVNSTAGLKTQNNEVFLDSFYGDVNSTGIELCIAADLPIEVWTVNSESVINSLDPYITGVTSDNLIAGNVLYNANIE